MWYSKSKVFNFFIILSIMIVPLNLGRQCTIWSEEAKAMFDSEFSDYMSKDYGYPSKCIDLKLDIPIYFRFKFLWATMVESFQWKTALQ